MEQVVTKKRAVRGNPVNIPNALTLLRIVLVPVFLYLLFLENPPARWWALAVFILAALSDFLDGEIARRWNIITDFGKIADPIADKALTLGAFIALSVEDPTTMPWWATLLIAIRELGITWWRGVLLNKGIVVPANWGGKVKTTLQLFLIFIIIMPWDLINPTWVAPMQITTLITLYATVLITVGTGIEYVWAGWKYGSTRA